MKIILLFSKFVILLTFFSNSYAGSIFSLTMTIGSSTITRGYGKAEEVIDAIKLSKIQTLFPSYAGTELVTMNLDFRGLPVTLSYAASSNSLVFSIPSISVSKTFVGSDRDDANSQFKKWLKSDGGSALNQMMAKLAEVSSSDPIAGNPASMMSQMVANDFGRSFNTPSPPATKGGDTNNQFGIGMKASRFTSNGQETKSFTAPIGYTWKFDFDPRHQISLSLPISYVQVEESKSYNLSLGLGYQFPVAEHWLITPSIGYGIVGSIDLGSVGQVVSTSVSSSYHWDLRNSQSIGLCNMIGHYQTLKFSYGGITVDPGLSNQVFRNGVLYTIPNRIFGWDASTELFVLDTRFVGSKLYMNSYQELGFSEGSNKSVVSLAKYIRIGASYLHSSKAKGFTLNFGYSF